MDKLSTKTIADKSLLVLIALLVIIGGSYFYWLKMKPQNKPLPSPAPIASFDDCVTAGYPVMESYPARCSTPDGTHFTENIGNELEMANMIKIDSPRPNPKIASPLELTGQARGTWYFEAVFPVELQDSNGNVLATGQAQAQGDWMTEDFVPFAASLEFAAPATPTGTLILKKDNPSGLPENDMSLKVPIKF